NAADARIKTSSDILLTHSSRSRSVINRISTQFNQSEPLSCPAPFDATNGGAGYSGNLSLLVSARFTSNSPKSSDGLMIVVGAPPDRLLTSGSSPAAIKSLLIARTSS